MLRVGIIGAKAYTARELVRLLARHPRAQLCALQARVDAPAPLAESHPSLRGVCELTIDPVDLDALAAKCDFVFLTLPHMSAAEYAAQLLERGLKVGDLSADFRYRKVETYEKVYGLTHVAPQLNDEAIYALPELFREQLKGRRLLAIPGCYVTCNLLGLAPLMTQPWVKQNSIIADSKSGVSGGGRGLKEPFHFCEANESLSAYGTATHRHQSEIEENLSVLAGEPVQILFSPHLVPMDRGILSTIYVGLRESKSVEEIHALYAKFYAGEKFVRLLPPGQTPRTRDSVLTNYCDIGLVVDPRTDRLIVVAALDNLVKGASGQAIQAMNVALGFEETAGLF